LAQFLLPAESHFSNANPARTLVPKATPSSTPSADPQKCAEQAGLRYVTDQTPGYYRHGRGHAVYYTNARGRRIRDRTTLDRISSLVIPPAWTDVWIAPRPHDHLQATGRDARGRKQFRYHARWREHRDAVKFENLVAFAKALPRIRRRVSRDLRRRGVPRERVLAAVVRLLETTLIRVGNDEYARTNNSFGLTTMKDRHAQVRGKKVRFRFRGKSGVERAIDLESPTLARIVKRCQDLPGQELLQYVDDDSQVCDIGSADVNDYLRRISGLEISAKDFRTWAGTALAVRALQEFEEFDSNARAKRNVTAAIERVARRLGNTATVCRNCYVHPAIIDAYLDRSLMETLKNRTERELRGGIASLSGEEAAVLALLQERMKRDLGRGPRRAKRSRKTRLVKHR
jgi:DNA topoisomerase-1